MRLFFLAVSFLITSIGQAQTQQTGVTVMGKGVVEVTPDIVKIRVRVQNEGQSAKTVKSETDKDVNSVLNFLKTQSISKKDYQTDYVMLNKRNPGNIGRWVYSAQQAISITLRDIKRYESVMNGLLESGINRIDGVSFESSKREKYETEARKKAVLNAKGKAEDYANSLGLKVGQAQMINETGTSSPRPMMQMMDVAGSSSSSGQQTLALGQMEITAKVEVRFSLQLR